MCFAVWNHEIFQVKPSPLTFVVHTKRESRISYYRIHKWMKTGRTWKLKHPIQITSNRKAFGGSFCCFLFSLFPYSLCLREDLGIWNQNNSLPDAQGKESRIQHEEFGDFRGQIQLSGWEGIQLTNDSWMKQKTRLFYYLGRVKFESQERIYGWMLLDRSRPWAYSQLCIMSLIVCE